MSGDNFWSKVLYTDDCWLWTGAKSQDGYGNFWIGGKCKLAHRVIWAEAFGEIPQGVNVLHHCDNPPCVNPDHLFLGTQADNVHDCMEKGRRANTGAPGPHVGKLSFAERTAIQRLRKETTLTQEQVAEIFGVRAQTVAYWEKQA